MRYQRDLDYLQTFYLSVIQKLVYLVVVIAIAASSPSFWAIVIGDIIWALLYVAGSYAVHPYRPTLTLRKAQAQWIFSFWLLCRSLVGHFRGQIDLIFADFAFRTDDLGRYNLSRNFAVLPGYDLLVPAVEPLLAVLSRSKSCAERLAFLGEYNLLPGYVSHGLL